MFDCSARIRRPRSEELTARKVGGFSQLNGVAEIGHRRWQIARLAGDHLESGAESEKTLDAAIGGADETGRGNCRSPGWAQRPTGAGRGGRRRSAGRVPDLNVAGARRRGRRDPVGSKGFDCHRRRNCRVSRRLRTYWVPPPGGGRPRRRSCSGVCPGMQAIASTVTCAGGRIRDLAVDRDLSHAIVGRRAAIGAVRARPCRRSAPGHPRDSRWYVPRSAIGTLTSRSLLMVSPSGRELRRARRQARAGCSAGSGAGASGPGGGRRREPVDDPEQPNAVATATPNDFGRMRFALPCSPPGPGMNRLPWAIQRIQASLSTATRRTASGLLGQGSRPPSRAARAIMTATPSSRR